MIENLVQEYRNPMIQEPLPVDRLEQVMGRNYNIYACNSCNRHDPKHPRYDPRPKRSEMAGMTSCYPYGSCYGEGKYGAKRPVANTVVKIIKTVIGGS